VSFGGPPPDTRCREQRRPAQVRQFAKPCDRTGDVTVARRALTALAIAACGASVLAVPARAGPRARASRTVHYLRFQTGTDRGQRYPAAVCEVRPLGEEQLYCWTPNDGYTITMLGFPIGNGEGAVRNTDRPRRFRSDEQMNRGRLLSGARYLPDRAVEREGVLTCVSRRSGLHCRNAGGHGWDLPRYHGLPCVF
jgi:hypothetical protein